MSSPVGSGPAGDARSGQAGAPGKRSHVDPGVATLSTGGILVLEGTIADVGPHLSASAAPENAHVIDCREHVIAPGLVDLQAFMGEPGAEYRETLGSASAPPSPAA